MRWHKMRTPCKYCAAIEGYLAPRSGQNVVRCVVCHRANYNAPRSEAVYEEPEEVQEQEQQQLTLFGKEECADV